MSGSNEPRKFLVASVQKGVVVARLEVNSLMHELLIQQVEAELVSLLPTARTAIVVDCRELRLHVSTQFLGVLVKMHKVAEQAGIHFAVCEVTHSLRAGYDLTGLSSVIRSFETLEQALSALGALSLARDDDFDRVAALP